MPLKRAYPEGVFIGHSQPQGGLPMPDSKDILADVIKFMTPLVPQGQQLTPDTDLVADLGFDSLKVMKLLEEVEDSYDISIPLNVLPEIRTVSDFSEQLQRILEEGD
jgi:acyl carrier protein